MSEIRYDRLHDSHVIIAPERLHRPDYSIRIKEQKKINNNCPFCEGNEKMTPPEIFAIRNAKSFANEKGWQTRVVPNLYKAVQIETPYEHHYGIFEHWEGFGAHEVIIDTPEHRISMTEWSESNAVNWLKTLRERVSDLTKDTRIAYISLFKNEGTNAGATQEHSHTQLIGLPIIPKEQKDDFLRHYEHYRHNNNSLFALMIEEEEKQDKDNRVIATNGDFIAFCPYASAHPFEIIISSKKSVGQINTLSDNTIETLAALLLNTLKKLQTQLYCIDFNLSISTPPLREGCVEAEVIKTFDAANRFYIRIMPRIYKHGGFEQSTGIMINPVSPELAAKLLREN